MTGVKTLITQAPNASREGLEAWEKRQEASQAMRGGESERTCGAQFKPSSAWSQLYAVGSVTPLWAKDNCL